jgi:hypothetical protein
MPKRWYYILSRILVNRDLGLENAFGTKATCGPLFSNSSLEFKKSKKIESYKFS